MFLHKDGHAAQSSASASSAVDDAVASSAAVAGGEARVHFDKLVDDDNTADEERGDESDADVAAPGDAVDGTGASVGRNGKGADARMQRKRGRPVGSTCERNIRGNRRLTTTVPIAPKPSGASINAIKVEDCGSQQQQRAATRKTPVGAGGEGRSRRKTTIEKRLEADKPPRAKAPKRCVNGCAICACATVASAVRDTAGDIDHDGSVNGSADDDEFDDPRADSICRQLVIDDDDVNDNGNGNVGGDDNGCSHT